MLKYLYYLLFVTSLLSIDSLALRGQKLHLDNAADLFKGDWLDTWEDPKDERFISQKIDLKKHFEHSTYIREELYKLRTRFADRFHEIESLSDPDYLQLGKDISLATKEFIIKYLDKARPANISKEEMAFIGFGSMARGEAGIVTDLEGSLLWDPNVIGKDTLGLVFGQALSNILDGLIGHPIYGIRGFRLDEADHSPFHRAPWARLMPLSEAFCMALKAVPAAGVIKRINSFRKNYYFPFEGSWVYTNATPHRLANFVAAGYIDSWPDMWSTNVKEHDFETEWYQWAEPFLDVRFIQKDYIAKVLKVSSCVKGLSQDEIDNSANKISLRLQSNEIATISNFPQLSRNRTFIYGNVELFKKFEEEREKILNDDNQYLRRKLAFKYLNEVVDGFSSSITDKAPDTADIKRQNYRFEEQVYTNLAFLLDLDQQNQGDIIKYLIKDGKLGKKFANKALERVNQIFRLRLKKQIILQSQLGANMQFLTEAAHKKKLDSLNDDLKKYESIAKNHKDEPERLRAQTIVAELKSDLKIMPQLIPGHRDSIFTLKDVDYIHNFLFPEQADVMKRLKKFLKDNENKDSLKYNFYAFSDEFDGKK